VNLRVSTHEKQIPITENSDELFIIFFFVIKNQKKIKFEFSLLRHNNSY